MKTKNILYLILLLVGLSSAAYAEDACEKLLPAPLRDTVLKKYPDYRIVKSTDRLTQDPKWDKRYYKEGQCNTVVTADFDGDKTKDFAFFLVHKDTKKPKLIVALSLAMKWSINELPIWNESIEGCYVKTISPGTYEQTKSYDSEQLRANERAKISTTNTSILAGKVESTGVVYVYEKGRWLYVWVTN